jgi:hypothetical protein|tara:strand:- start:1901 stop:2197 length:297 start_codon:yes stop_codon:yes gene_type:complete
MAGVPEFSTGSKTSIGTTAVPITTRELNASRGVQIMASTTNSVTVYIGPKGVTAGTSSADTDGYPLAAGEAVVVPVIEPSKIYAITASSTAAISYMLV